MTIIGVVYIYIRSKCCIRMSIVHHKYHTNIYLGILTLWHIIIFILLRENYDYRESLPKYNQIDRTF